MTDDSDQATGGLKGLHRRLAAATGCDGDLDRMIAQVFDEAIAEADPAPYTASVDHCLKLLQHRLAGWSWHVGYDVTGAMPYVVVADVTHRVEETAPTVPLALLRAITRAWLAVQAAASTASSGQSSRREAS